MTKDKQETIDLVNRYVAAWQLSLAAFHSVPGGEDRMDDVAALEAEISQTPFGCHMINAFLGREKHPVQECPECNGIGQVYVPVPPRDVYDTFGTGGPHEWQPCSDCDNGFIFIE